MIAHSHREDGYTILEIVLTIAILSIALIPLMEMLPRALLLDDQLEQRARAAFLAQRKLEEVKGKAIYDFDQDYTESATAFAAPDAKFKYTVTDQEADGIKEVGVNVWYDTDSSGSAGDDEENVELNTKIARRD